MLARCGLNPALTHGTRLQYHTIGFREGVRRVLPLDELGERSSDSEPWARPARLRVCQQLVRAQGPEQPAIITQPG